ncbi:hypothetical protein ANME2D_01413 [Candidatus Methanoperedens nitroreducens]|uniref:DUF1015 domain-containing protein n=1 Tax=Candidatus Methanoperedens nitratireducens TaxID=1392998 RepID=A0A062V620_9EURY|nr:DUF1015 domain-containing protein [Candidatus Methanoperedens nitroreducens]KCZ72013.1 hypothetical protein ANME2D_01413 [Candidatus Methanoperedens nitroreducens]MDJ1422010.1 DUF1015 domain-containing protein [Candidatus Methanoperedens sp.]
MVDIRPFKATVLNPELDIDKLICPVYDTIDATNYQRFARERNNIIHVTTRRKDMDRDEFIGYAKENLDRLIDSKVLVEREKPALYIYGIKYTVQPEILIQIPEEDRESQYFALGLVCLVRVEELGARNIAGHENVFEINTKERYRLMKACMMNFSPIAVEYSMSDHGLNNILKEYLGFKRSASGAPDKPPLVDAALNGSRHLLWEIADENLIEKIMNMVSDLKILILDGHHRYTASCLMKETDGIEYTVMMLMESDDRALLLLPWHRAIRNFSIQNLEHKIKEKFSIEWQSEEYSEEFYAQLRERKSEYDIRIGMYDGKRFSVLRADEKAVQELLKQHREGVGIDLMVLHNWLINPVIKKPEEDVSFNASPAEAISRVRSREFDVAFFLNPLSIRDVERKAFVERNNFPQKSTLFLPKVAEGIVMRSIK